MREHAAIELYSLDKFILHGERTKSSSGSVNRKCALTDAERDIVYKKKSHRLTLAINRMI